ncbi:hypothetical protein HELRODRAFT_178850 [Helobdella robusta]|uniref:SOCS box domain-containing protein n=1 Tax=Helobdella robusta TaxID=6412 RepID=T1FDT7_HELRO|nr:hypothetical protein HELRODRAFT_178850 [Helobdella robusta]ESN95934.1 hypothetical protein HELRODRAFT_178850 [Helobdella robusta]
MKSFGISNVMFMDPHNDTPFFKRILFMLCYRKSMSKMKSDFISYVYSNNPQKVDSIVRKLSFFNCAPNFSDKQLALDIAIYKNSLGIVELLINMNVDVNFPSRRNRTEELPITYAMRLKHYDIVELLLDAGSFVEIRSSNYEKFTALHYACIDGNYYFAKKFIQRGADVNRGTDKGHTPLYYATINDHCQLAFYLVLEGASVNFTIKRNRVLRKDDITNFYNFLIKLLSIFQLDVNSINEMNRNVDTGMVQTVSSNDLCHYSERISSTFSEETKELALEKIKSQLTPMKLAECLVDAQLLQDNFVTDLLISFGTDVNYKPEHGINILLKTIKTQDWPRFNVITSMNETILNDFEIPDQNPLLNALKLNDFYRQGMVLLIKCGDAGRKNHNVKSKIILQALQIKNLDILKLLFLSGFQIYRKKYQIRADILCRITIFEESVHLNDLKKCKDWLSCKKREGLTLKEHCRIVIRQSISEHNGGRSVLPYLEQLSLPKILVLYLKFYDLTCVQKFFDRHILKSNFIFTM